MRTCESHAKSATPSSSRLPLVVVGLCLYGMGLNAYDAWYAVHVEKLGLASTWTGVALALGVMAIGASFVIGANDHRQLYHSWLVSYMYFLSIALGGMFFVLLLFATKAGWAVALRRLAENVMWTLPVFVLLFVPIWMGSHDLFHWTHADAVEHDALLQAKQGYLNVNFFLIRAACYFLVWTVIALWYGRQSRLQDETGDHEVTRRLQRWSGPAIILAAVTVSFAAIDWIMWWEKVRMFVAVTTEPRKTKIKKSTR